MFGRKVKIKRKSTLIDMTAMSDVTVLLLTFFMLTSTFLQKEPTIVYTPSSVSEEKVPVKDLVTILVSSEDKSGKLADPTQVEGKIFLYLMMIATCAACISWFVITITHLKFKAYCAQNGKATKFQAILYPFTDYLSLAFLIGVIFFMSQVPDMQLAVLFLPIWLCVLWVGYQFRKKK